MKLQLKIFITETNSI